MKKSVKSLALTLLLTFLSILSFQNISNAKSFANTKKEDSQITLLKEVRPIDASLNTWEINLRLEEKHQNAKVVRPEEKALAVNKKEKVVEDKASLQIKKSENSDNNAKKIKDIKIVEDIANGFYISNKEFAKIQLNQGKLEYKQGKLIWNIGSLENLTSSNKNPVFAELKYIVEIDDNILTQQADSRGEYKINNSTSLEYIDLNNKLVKKYYPVSKVRPVFYEVEKILLDSKGNEIKEDRDFSIKINHLNRSSQTIFNDFVLNTANGKISTGLRTDLRSIGEYMIFEDFNNLDKNNFQAVKYYLNAREITNGRFNISASDTGILHLKVVNQKVEEKKLDPQSGSQRNEKPKKEKLEKTEDLLKKKVLIEFSNVRYGWIEELAGAKLKIVKGIDLDGKTLFTWTSGKKSKKIELEEGVYTFIEESAPKGYEKDRNIYFRINNKGRLEVVQNATWVEKKDFRLVMQNDKINLSSENKKDEKKDKKEKSNIKKSTSPSNKKRGKKKTLAKTGSQENNKLKFVAIVLIAIGLSIYVYRANKKANE